MKSKKDLLFFLVGTILLLISKVTSIPMMMRNDAEMEPDIPLSIYDKQMDNSSENMIVVYGKSDYPIEEDKVGFKRVLEYLFEKDMNNEGNYNLKEAMQDLENKMGEEFENLDDPVEKYIVEVQDVLKYFFKEMFKIEENDILEDVKQDFGKKVFHDFTGIPKFLQESVIPTIQNKLVKSAKYVTIEENEFMEAQYIPLNKVIDTQGETNFPIAMSFEYEKTKTRREVEFTDQLNDQTDETTEIIEYKSIENFGKVESVLHPPDQNNKATKTEVDSLVNRNLQPGERTTSVLPVLIEIEADESDEVLTDYGSNRRAFKNSPNFVLVYEYPPVKEDVGEIEKYYNRIADKVRKAAMQYNREEDIQDSRSEVEKMTELEDTSSVSMSQVQTNEDYTSSRNSKGLENNNQGHTITPTVEPIKDLTTSLKEIIELIEKPSNPTTEEGEIMKEMLTETSEKIDTIVQTSDEMVNVTIPKKESLVSTNMASGKIINRLIKLNETETYNSGELLINYEEFWEALENLSDLELELDYLDEEDIEELEKNYDYFPDKEMQAESDDNKEEFIQDHGLGRIKEVATSSKGIIELIEKPGNPTIEEGEIMKEMVTEASEKIDTIVQTSDEMVNVTIHKRENLVSTNSSGEIITRLAKLNETETIKSEQFLINFDEDWEAYKNLSDVELEWEYFDEDWEAYKNLSDVELEWEYFDEEDIEEFEKNCNDLPDKEMQAETDNNRQEYIQDHREEVEKMTDLRNTRPNNKSQLQSNEDNNPSSNSQELENKSKADKISSNVVPIIDVTTSSNGIFEIIDQPTSSTVEAREFLEKMVTEREGKSDVLVQRFNQNVNVTTPTRGKLVSTDLPPGERTTNRLQELNKIEIDESNGLIRHYKAFISSPDEEIVWQFDMEEEMVDFVNDDYLYYEMYTDYNRDKNTLADTDYNLKENIQNSGADVGKMTETKSTRQENNFQVQTNEDNNPSKNSEELENKSKAETISPAVIKDVNTSPKRTIDIISKATSPTVEDGPFQKKMAQKTDAVVKISEQKVNATIPKVESLFSTDQQSGKIITSLPDLNDIETNENVGVLTDYEVNWEAIKHSPDYELQSEYFPLDYLDDIDKVNKDYLDRNIHDEVHIVLEEDIQDPVIETEEMTKLENTSPKNHSQVQVNEENYHSRNPYDLENRSQADTISPVVGPINDGTTLSNRNTEFINKPFNPTVEPSEFLKKIVTETENTDFLLQTSDQKVNVIMAKGESLVSTDLLSGEAAFTYLPELIIIETDENDGLPTDNDGDKKYYINSPDIELVSEYPVEENTEDFEKFANDLVLLKIPDEVDYNREEYIHESVVEAEDMTGFLMSRPENNSHFQINEENSTVINKDGLVKMFRENTISTITEPIEDVTAPTTGKIELINEPTSPTIEQKEFVKNELTETAEDTDTTEQTYDQKDKVANPKVKSGTLMDLSTEKTTKTFVPVLDEIAKPESKKALGENEKEDFILENIAGTERKPDDLVEDRMTIFKNEKSNFLKEGSMSKTDAIYLVGNKLSGLLKLIVKLAEDSSASAEDTWSLKDFLRSADAILLP